MVDQLVLSFASRPASNQQRSHSATYAKHDKM
jgi:hypothetical protein